MIGFFNADVSVYELVQKIMSYFISLRFSSDFLLKSSSHCTLPPSLLTRGSFCLTLQFSFFMLGTVEMICNGLASHMINSLVKNEQNRILPSLRNLYFPNSTTRFFVDILVDVLDLM